MSKLRGQALADEVAKAFSYLGNVSATVGPRGMIEVSGHNLVPHPDLADRHPNGWSLSLRYTPEECRKNLPAWHARNRLMQQYRWRVSCDEQADRTLFRYVITLKDAGIIGMGETAEEAWLDADGTHCFVHMNQDGHRYPIRPLVRIKGKPDGWLADRYTEPPVPLPLAKLPEIIAAVAWDNHRGGENVNPTFEVELIV